MVLFSASGAEIVRAPKTVATTPRILCVQTNTAETLSFLNQMRQRLLNPPISGMRVLASRAGSKRKSAPRWIGRYINFTDIEYITPTTALILAAEYDRARTLRQQNTRNISRLFVVDADKWSSEVFNTLYDVGFFDLLEIAETAPDQSDADKRNLRFRSGAQNDFLAISGLLDELEAMFKDVGLNADDACFELNGALGEAMENCVRCAYPEGADLPFKHIGRWWMTGGLSRSERRMKVAIFDQGISIPGSLSGWKFYETFAVRFAKFLGFGPDLSEPKYDGDVIRLAIEESATSTYMDKHGKGLGHIKAFVDLCASGKLTIISRHGYYEYSKGLEPIVRALDVNLGGTLVEWDVVI